MTIRRKIKGQTGNRYMKKRIDEVYLSDINKVCQDQEGTYMRFFKQLHVKQMWLVSTQASNLCKLLSHGYDVDEANCSVMTTMNE